MKPSLDDARDMARWWPLTAFWAAGWMVTHTPLPSSARNVLAFLLVAVPVVVVVVVAEWTSLNSLAAAAGMRTSVSDVDFFNPQIKASMMSVSTLIAQLCVGSLIYEFKHRIV